ERRLSPYHQPEMVVADDGWLRIRDMLTKSMDNNGTPRIDVINGEHSRAGELYLKHEFDGRSLDPQYVEKTLPYIHALWRRPVHIETREAAGNKVLIYTYEGKKVKKHTK
ncbi:MAG: hypothetical protein KDA17_07915, partial [Candidatus Saccharibacteria bacterium]|nr:hypothetical protein [Candidatus Saccharibacteria bacterium]